jgi:hypothetical protein
MTLRLLNFNLLITLPIPKSLGRIEKSMSFNEKNNIWLVFTHHIMHMIPTLPVSEASNIPSKDCEFFKSNH